jgi:hydrogenase expression/formation protein HypC
MHAPTARLCQSVLSKKQTLAIHPNKTRQAMCLAIPGRIKSIEAPEGAIRKAKVAFGPILKEAWLDMLPEAREGDYVLVHAGVAINLVNEKEAFAAFDYLERYGGLDELLPEQDLC